MTEKQHTLKNDVSLSGKGLHSGKLVNVTIKPAATNFGYCFKRIDLEGQPEVPAIADYVGNTARGTTLVHNNAEIMTLEHLMAAMYALGFDNALIFSKSPIAC